VDVLGDRAQIAKGEAGRDGAARLKLVAVGHLLGFNEDVVDAQQIDGGEGIRLGAARDGEHGDHGADAKDHTQHGEHAAHFVHEQALQAHQDFGK